MSHVNIILCTCPDKDTADKIARHLIEQQLAACVSILPQVTSVYQWQGQTEIAEEHLLIIKSPHSAYKHIESLIQSLHPYEIPEIIAIPVEHGLPGYINWINTCHTAT